MPNRRDSQARASLPGNAGHPGQHSAERAPQKRCERPDKTALDVQGCPAWLTATSALSSASFDGGQPPIGESPVPRCGHHKRMLSARTSRAPSDSRPQARRTPVASRAAAAAPGRAHRPSLMQQRWACDRRRHLSANGDFTHALGSQRLSGNAQRQVHGAGQLPAPRSPTSSPAARRKRLSEAIFRWGEHRTTCGRNVAEPARRAIRAARPRRRGRLPRRA